MPKSKRHSSRQSSKSRHNRAPIAAAPPAPGAASNAAMTDILTIQVKSSYKRMLTMVVVALTVMILFIGAYRWRSRSGGENSTVRKPAAMRRGAERAGGVTGAVRQPPKSAQCHSDMDCPDETRCHRDGICVPILRDMPQVRGGTELGRGREGEKGF